MWRSILVVLGLTIGQLNFAQAAPGRIWWPGWTVETSEELSLGMKYSRDSATPAYPLNLMFDNNPATAWVFSSTSNDWWKDQFPCRYGIKIQPAKPITLDQIRIMNGQNESVARFQRNDRVSQLKLSLFSQGKKLVKTFNLKDKMGWQSISFPPTQVIAARLEFVGLKKGKGPQNDLCISELALFNAGQKIDMKMPKAVMFLDGTEGCTASLLIDDTGKYLDGIAMDVGYEDVWNSTGRYVSGLAGGQKPHVWVADAAAGKIIRRVYLEDADYEWKDANTLAVTPTMLRSNKPVDGRTQYLKFR